MYHARQHQFLAEAGIAMLTLSAIGHFFGDIAGMLGCLWYAIQLHDRLKHGWKTPPEAVHNDVEAPKKPEKK